MQDGGGAGRLPWKGNLSEIKIILDILKIFQFLDFISNFLEMALKWVFEKVSDFDGGSSYISSYISLEREFIKDSNSF